MIERLERFLADAEPGRGARVLSYQPISGGYSRISARASVRWADGREETLILRGDPPAGSGVFVSDRDAEWELLSALPNLNSVATAPTRWYDSSGDYLGAKCIVMQSIDATSLQAVLADADDIGPLSDLFVDTFAAIHRSRLDPLPERMTRPSDWMSYLDGVLATYDQVAESHPSVAPVVRYVTRWAAGHRPPPVPLALVHGDCQPSNVLVSEAQPPIVIDWEFAHIGDPREDLGYYNQIPLLPNVYWSDSERFLARYRAATGMTEDQINPDVVDYFLIIGMATLYAQLVDAADAVANNQHPGILASYLINAISHQHDMFLSICDRRN